MKPRFFWAVYLQELTIAEYYEDTDSYLVPGCENSHVKEEFDEIGAEIINQIQTQ